MVDEDGFRLNVGIIITNEQKQLFWARRVGQDAWQFPQGGVNENESLEETLYRELYEEVGLSRGDVEVVAESQHWFSYRLPRRLIRMEARPCIGQKQKWFMLRLVSPEQNVKLDLSIKPEFDEWCWVSYWFPLQQVITFKREVYRQALLEFAPILMDIRPSSDLDSL